MSGRPFGIILLAVALLAAGLAGIAAVWVAWPRTSNTSPLAALLALVWSCTYLVTAFLTWRGSRFAARVPCGDGITAVSILVHLPRGPGHSPPAVRNHLSLRAARVPVSQEPTSAIRLEAAKPGGCSVRAHGWRATRDKRRSVLLICDNPISRHTNTCHRHVAGKMTARLQCGRMGAGRRQVLGLVARPWIGVRRDRDRAGPRGRGRRNPLLASDALRGHAAR
jgi:hypothetical protein